MKPIAGILFLLASCLVASPAVAQQHVRAELLADTTAVQPGKPFTLAIRLHVDDGWHVYWLNPGDAGAATRVSFNLPAGFTAGPVEYPVPQRLPQPGGLIVYAYENELVLRATVNPPSDLNGLASVPISADVHWCVCSDICILGKKTLQLTLPTAAHGVSPANAELFSAWNPRFPVASDNAFTSVDTEVAGSPGRGGELNAIVRCTWRNDPPDKDFLWLPGPSDDLTVQASSITTTGRVTTISLNIEPVQGISPASSTIDGVLAYNGIGHQARGVAMTLQRASLDLAAAK